MTHMRRLAACLFISMFLAVTGPALAASIPLTWNPVPGAGIRGYRLYYGTAPRSYGSSLDVGNVTHYTLTGLANCTRYYLAVKAYDAAGRLSTAYSNEISGLPTPVISLVSPTFAEQGQALTISLSGTSFDLGASARFSNKVNVLSTSFVSCTQVRSLITVAGDATGTNDLRVTNPDQSIGTLYSALNIVPTTVPIVVWTNPAEGALNISTLARPSVTFSESMMPLSIKTSTVRLLAPDGSAVAQAVGSPSLDGTGRIATITPATALYPGIRYHIQVVGGVLGVRDSQNTQMSSTFVQPVGFLTTTANASDPSPAPSPGISTTGPSLTTADVPVDIQPSITFTTEMDADSITAETISLVGPAGQVVPQAEGSPSLDSSGRVATLIPAQPLEPGKTYRIRVAGRERNVHDVNGHPLERAFSPVSGFTTASSPETELPSVVGTQPTEGAALIPRDVEPSLTFSRPMDPTSLTTDTVILVGPRGVPVEQGEGSPRLDASGTVLTITPARELEPGVTYWIQVTGGGEGARDTDGSPLRAPVVQGFSTLDDPSHQETLLAIETFPADGAQGVSSDVIPSVTFSRAVDPASLSPESLRLIQDDGTEVPQTDGSPVLEASGTTVTIHPASRLVPGAIYRIEVPAGLMDTTFAQEQGFQVDAEEAGRPIVVSMSPAQGEANVLPIVDPTIVFSEPVDSGTIDSSTIALLQRDGSAIEQAPGSPGLDASGTVVTIIPAHPLHPGTLYRILVAGGPAGVKDRGGNAMTLTTTGGSGFVTRGGGSESPLP